MNVNLRVQHDLAAFHARHNRVERAQFVTAFAKLSDADLLGVARAAAAEILGADTADMNETDALATIEDALIADFEKRDPDQMTPDERGHLAHWQKARSIRQRPSVA